VVRFSLIGRTALHVVSNGATNGLPHATGSVAGMLSAVGVTRATDADAPAADNAGGDAFKDTNGPTEYPDQAGDGHKPGVRGVIRIFSAPASARLC